MTTIRVFLSENFQFLEVKFSIYLNRRVLVNHLFGEILIRLAVPQSLIWIDAACSSRYVRIFYVNKVFLIQKSSRNELQWFWPVCLSQSRNLVSQLRGAQGVTVSGYMYIWIVRKNQKSLFPQYSFLLKRLAYREKISRQHFDFFLIFQKQKNKKKQDLTFHAICLLRRQFAWTIKAYCFGENKYEKRGKRLNWKCATDLQYFI